MVQFADGDMDRRVDILQGCNHLGHIPLGILGLFHPCLAHPYPVHLGPFQHHQDLLEEFLEHADVA
jgi:hypothetical protein